MERISVIEQQQNAQIAHEIREEYLVEATGRNRINLLMKNFGEREPRISVIRNGYNAAYFARAVPDSQITVSEMELPETPMEMLLYDYTETRNLIEQYRQIAKHIPDFIYSLYPKSSGLPIYVFQSLKDYRNREPTAKIEIKKSLVTVEINNSKLKSPNNP